MELARQRRVLNSTTWRVRSKNRPILAAIAFSIGEPRSMKVGNASSPWRY